MNRWHWKKSLTACVIGLALAWLAAMWLPVAAQDDGSGGGVERPVGAAVAADPQADAVIPPLGQPGLSFRYVQTFGETGVAYFEDTQHLYAPMGLGVDGNNVWIAEYEGLRALKFTSSGQFLQQIGKARIVDYYNQSIRSPGEVGVDSSGNVWLAVGSTGTVLKFDAQGVLKMALGSTWNHGDANDRFDQPMGIAFDSAGRIYISDGAPDWNRHSGNHRIQVFDAQGAYLSTIGTTGVSGAGNLQFDGPQRIAIYQNLLYVADSGNERVQILDITNPAAPIYVATLGITDVNGGDNGHFNYPSGVAVDANFIYVADRWNNRVQVFNRTTRAYVATLGGQWGATNSQMDNPRDVAVDAAGNLYVSDTGNDRVQQFNQARQYVRTYGVTGVPYTTDLYHVNEPRGVAVANDGSVYVVEEYGNRLIKFNASGAPQWSIGQPGVNGGWDGENNLFNQPEDVAIAPSGNIFVVDTWNHRIQVFAPSGAYVRTLGVTGESGQDNAHFNGPRGVGFGPDGSLYVADGENARVQIFDANLTYIATLGVTGQPGSDNNHFVFPEDVAVDSAGVIYVADGDAHRIQVFGANRAYLRTMGETNKSGWDFAHFDSPRSLVIDANRRLYVADGWNGRVQVYDEAGAYLTTIGGGVSSRTGDLRATHSIAVDAAGNVYVGEYWDNHRVQKFAPGTPNWRQVNINGFGTRNRGAGALASFGGKLAAGTYAFSGGADLWQLNGGWTQAATGGFGDPTNTGIVRLFEFGGQLYAGVDNWDEAADRSTGAQLLRSSNGTSWTPVMTGGFGRIDNGGIFAIDAFSGTLYAATYSYTSTHGAELWRSATGNAGDWQQVVPNGFGDVNNRAIFTFGTHNGYFYAGTVNFQTGPEIWRSADGQNWNKIAANGFGDSSLTTILALKSFNGYLYSGVYSNPRTSTTTPILRRCQLCDGSDWQPVAPLRFGNAANMAVESLLVYNRVLYAFTGNQTTGMEVWRTSDGASWAQVGFAGLGDTNNYYPLYNNATVIHNGNLYVGNWNNYAGGKIWQYIPDRATVDIVDPAQPATLTFTPATGGQSTVQIPANALDQATELVYEPFTPSTQPAGFAFAGRAFELNAYRANALVENLNFLQPVTVILDYTDAEVAGQDESKLELRRWDVATSAWVDAACGAYDRQPAQNRLSVPVCHLSQFGLFGPMEYLYLPAVRR
jgi:sugar lactone lactonase YvrE